MTSSSTYYFTNAMTNLFVNTADGNGATFQSISTMEDFWTVSFLLFKFLMFLQNTQIKGANKTAINPFVFDQYAQGPLLDGLYWTRWYNNQSLNIGDQSFIYYENMLLGVPRIRQIKIKNNSCQVHKDFKNEISGCYDVYNEKKEDDLSFGLINGTA